MKMPLIKVICWQADTGPMTEYLGVFTITRTLERSVISLHKQQREKVEKIWKEDHITEVNLASDNTVQILETLPNFIGRVRQIFVDDATPPEPPKLPEPETED